jgi:hypothetical protein
MNILATPITSTLDSQWTPLAQCRPPARVRVDLPVDDD